MKFEAMRGRRFRTGLVALALCGVLAPSAPALAQHGRGGGWASRGGAHAPGAWHGGGHRGHPGWGWSGGFWYLGPGLPYAYPWPYPSAVYRVPATPPVVLPESGAVPSPPPVPSWYYCEVARGYYPYVATCPGGWKAVPAVPADASPASP